MVGIASCGFYRDITIMETRQAQVFFTVFSAWSRAWNDRMDLRIQSDPDLLRLYREKKKDIPNLDQKLKESHLRMKTLWDEVLSLIEPGMGMEESVQTSIPDEYDVLKERVAKGKDWLQREYWDWNAKNGRVRNDPRVNRALDQWEDMVFRLIELEKRKNA